MVRSTPPTPPTSSPSKPTTLSPSRRRITQAAKDNGGTGNTSANNSSIFRSMRDTGTVGAVANAGSDLSYDLSSTGSAVESNDDNDENVEFKKDDGEDNDFSLDDDKERRGKNNGNNRKNEENMDNMAVVIQDLYQLEIDDGNIADYDDDGSLDEFNSSHDDGDEKGELDLEQIAEWIKSGKCNNIVVLSGAGISCAAGIPDFRTPGSGL